MNGVREKLASLAGSCRPGEVKCSLFSLQEMSQARNISVSLRYAALDHKEG